MPHLCPSLPPSLWLLLFVEGRSQPFPAPACLGGLELSPLPPSEQQGPER